jgi:tRNA dimethylallyltransferase
VTNGGGPAAPLVAIVGPTAVGKSALALGLAEALERRTGRKAEIVSADSRQVYRGLDIGTAKPSRAEQAAVRHHLLDLVDPEDDFSLAEFQDRAYAAIDAVHHRGGLPLLVGGTGLYVRAVVEGLSLPRVAPDAALRAALAEQAANHGGLVDPVAAGRIDPRNLRRVIRALEVVLKTGVPFSQGLAPQPRYPVLTLGLTMEREALYRQIDARVEAQLAAGLLGETAAVLARGCSPTRPALTGFGYREMVSHLQGHLDLPTAVARYKFETHRFARQQNTWFRLDDRRIAWYERRGPALADAVDWAFDQIAALVERTGPPARPASRASSPTAENRAAVGQ